MSFFTASVSEGRSWFGQVNSEIILYLELQSMIYKCKPVIQVLKANLQQVLEIIMI